LEEKIILLWGRYSLKKYGKHEVINSF